MKADYTLVFDGGSLGNPGQGYGSYVLTRNLDGKKRVKRLKFNETMTSNQAEYRSLIAGLEDLVSTIKRAGRSPGHFALEVRGDSQLVLYQVARRWKTKDPDLMPLRDRVEELLTRLASVDLVWQTRDKSERVLGH